MRTTAIRGTAAAVLLTATVLCLAGCVNAEQPAPPGAGNSVSFGPPVTSASAPPTTTAATTSPSVTPTTQGTTTTATQSADRHNAADVTFAQQAVVLRRQALAMAGAAGTSGVSGQVRGLAGQFAQDAGPSVTTLTEWLSDWNHQAPAAADVHGALSTTQLSQLTAARGTSFDMKWLQYMKSNLAAAEQAATTEVADGASAQAKQAAQKWTTALRTESRTLNSIN